MISIQILHLSEDKMGGTVFSFHSIYLRVNFAAKAKYSKVYTQLLAYLSSVQLNSITHGTRPAHELFLYSNFIHICNNYS